MYPQGFCDKVQGVKAVIGPIRCENFEINSKSRVIFTFFLSTKVTTDDKAMINTRIRSVCVCVCMGVFACGMSDQLFSSFSIKVVTFIVLTVCVFEYYKSCFLFAFSTGGFGLGARH